MGRHNRHNYFREEAMKTKLITVVLLAAFAGLASAADNNIALERSVQINRLDERIAHLKTERDCLQAATTQEALKTCREKFRNEMKADKAGRRKQ
jgi:type II secretory pathway component PulJ